MRLSSLNHHIERFDCSVDGLRHCTRKAHTERCRAGWFHSEAAGALVRCVVEQYRYRVAPCIQRTDSPWESCACTMRPSQRVRAKPLPRARSPRSAGSKKSTARRSQSVKRMASFRSTGGRSVSPSRRRKPASSGLERTASVSQRMRSAGVSFLGAEKRSVADRLASRRAREEDAPDVDPEDELHSRSLRQTLRRSESMLDATVGPSLRSGGSGEQRDAIMALHVAVNSERQRRAKAEDELRSTEELVALKLEDLKSLSRRVKRLENENDLQVALEQESQKTFEYLGNEVGATKAKTAEDVVALRGELTRELAQLRTGMAAHEKVTSEQSEKLMVWLEKEAQEVCNLRARMDSLMRRTNTQLETQAAQVQGLRSALDKVAASAKEDAITLSSKMGQVRSQLHSMEGSLAQAGALAAPKTDYGSKYGTIQALSPAVAGGGAERIVDISDIRHQEIQQELSSLCVVVSPCPFPVLCCPFPYA